MSRRKQSKPRQIKRSLGDLDGGEENTADRLSLSGEDAGASEPEDSAEGDSCSSPPYMPVYKEEPRSQDLHGGPDEDEEGGEERRSEGGSSREVQEEVADGEEALRWKGPDDLQLRDQSGDSSVVTCRDLHADTTWGPYPGVLQSEGSTADGETEKFDLACEDPECWMNLLPLTSDLSAANCNIYSQGGQLFCKVTTALPAGAELLASLLPRLDSSSSPSSSSSSSSSVGQLSPALSLVAQSQAGVKEEPAYPAALHSDIQLLPQQAGMAAILATAIVNKDIFPCKDCGIWYRSERNLQAHLMYYCASRQKQPAAASSPPQDKPKDSYPNERVCPFPQCNKSCPSASSLEIHMRTHSGERPFVCLICLSAFTTKANCERHLKVHTDTLNGVCHGCGFVSTTRDILYSHLVTSHMVCQPGSRNEVYSPGPGLPKLPLTTAGLSPGDSGVVLKCQVCGHSADSPAQLQQHVRTHLEVRVPGERSPTPRQSTPSSGDGGQPQPSHRAREPAGSASPGADGSSATPRGRSPAPVHGAGQLRIKEEPPSDTETEEKMEVHKNGEEGAAGAGGGVEDAAPEPRRNPSAGRSSSNFSHSPKSPAPASVKAEPTSPTPGSSPAHGGGAVMLPQYLFNPEAAILPQASEILAKMSEMVHSRLKQGQAVPSANPAAAFFPPGPAAPTTAAATPPHKGATCFECDITFNNINNFYAHKRLYCSSRHPADAAASAPAPAGDAAPSPSPPGGARSRATSASPSGSDPADPRRVAEGGADPADSVETGGAKESSSEGEGGGGAGGGGSGSGGPGAERASDGSQSPASEDPEDSDPNKTFCEACNIRFTHHENYAVHKRFYCASRHDPSNQRSAHAAKAAAAAAATGAAFLPQPIRTRKRKKMYEIHMARTEALALAAAVKQELSPGGGGGSGGSSPEGDGPIDLSKRPRLRDAATRGAGATALPALPLSDYHKCTACSISFNSLQNYLAHKTYYCPATTLQPHALEQLQRLRCSSTSPKSRAGPPEAPPLPLSSLEAKATPPGRAGTASSSSSSSPSPLSSSLPPPSTTSSPQAATRGAGGPASPPVACPYCPGRLPGGELMEHLRSTHGLLLTPVGREAGGGGGAGLGPAEGAGEPGPLPRINGQPRSGAASPAASPPTNGGSWGEDRPASPQSPSGAAPSPASEASKEASAIRLQPAAANPAPKTAALPSAAMHNGNSRFCRLCNIKFSSLSTFIAHKKYYCSSHSAEHVK